tara:strand:+ start:11487 stop:11930 length:444 start_codon:yes stop_codon:yes gene_type:complete
MALIRPLKLLLVEDNDDHAKLIIETIQGISSEHSVKRVSDGEEALSYLSSAAKSPHEWPDLMMLDLKMPRLNGLETLTEIRLQAPSSLLPVVIVSTSGSRKEIQDAFDQGANSYLIKPLHFTELTSMIRDFVHYWSSVSETPGIRLE